MSVRDQALEMVQSLPVDATWDELLYRIYVRRAIERGLEDSSANRIIEVDELRRQFGSTLEEWQIPREDEVALLDARFAELDKGSVQAVSREEVQRQLREYLNR